MIYYIVFTKDGVPVDVISYGADRVYRDQCYSRYENNMSAYYNSVHKLDITP